MILELKRIHSEPLILRNGGKVAAEKPGQKRRRAQELGGAETPWGAGTNPLLAESLGSSPPFSTLWDG